VISRTVAGCILKDDTLKGMDVPGYKYKWGTGMLRFQLRSQGSVVQDLPVSGVVLLPEMRRFLRVVFRLISSLKLAADFFFSLLLHAALLRSMRDICALVRTKISAAKYLFFFQRKSAGGKEETNSPMSFTMLPHPNPSPEGRGDKDDLFNGRALTETSSKRSAPTKADSRGALARRDEFYGAVAVQCT